jgi:hypothetical protein
MDLSQMYDFKFPRKRERDGNSILQRDEDENDNWYTLRILYSETVNNVRRK